MEGTVRIEAVINPDGRVSDATAESGPFPFREPARAAVLQYVFVPFEEAGKPVSVQTMIEVAFRLPSSTARNASFIPPKLKLSDFNFMSSSTPVRDIPPSLQKLLEHDLTTREQLAGCSPATTASQDRIVRLEMQNSSIQLFLVARREPCLCDNDRNCPLQIIEGDAGQFHIGEEVLHQEVSIVHSSDSPFPEIFIAAQAATRIKGVTGFARFGGEWGPIYCGSIHIKKNGQETDDIRLCQ